MAEQTTWLKGFLPWIAFPLLLFGLPSMSITAAELQVYAAASLSDVLKLIGEKFETRHGHTLVYNFGSSSLLARQIEKGAPADIFFSADEAKMDQLQKADLIKRGSRRVIVKNQLVVVVPTNSLARVSSAKDLLQFKKIALAEPSSVPAGIYARQYLEREELWSWISGRVIPTDNVRSAVTAVAGHNADAAIVYASDANVSQKVKVALLVPITKTPNISYPAAVVNRSKQAGIAEQFLQFLSNEDSRRLFVEHKFLFAQ